MLGVDMEMDLSREEIQQILGVVGRKFAKEMTDKTNDDLKRNVTEGISKGESIDEIKERIKNVFVQAEEYRADRIARTETLRYNTGATEQAFIDSEVVEAKEWYANPGACENCAPMNGKIVALGENYIDKGEVINGIEYDYSDVGAPPLHPNCECDLVPVLLPTKELRLRDNLNRK
jgi:SPP1 gp7 family putative phage head morphogenesis protein